jgi:hypothetical protein
VDKSVKTAIEKHPRLIRYTICFPLDRADPRRDNEEWFMDKWEQQVEKWKRLARARGMSVEFDYWGEHELLTRLSREEHRGRFFFWFHRELLSNRWFQARLDEAIVGAGPRYTPALHVNLSIARLFDGLGRTTAFFERLGAQVASVQQTYRSISRPHGELSVEEYSRLRQAMQDISTLTRFDQEHADPIDWTQLQRVVATAYAEASNWAEKIEHAARERVQAASAARQTTQQEIRSTVMASDVRQFMRALSALEDSIQEDETRLTNVPALLLVGAAGTGKTHLFCDVAGQRLRQQGVSL